LLDWMRATLVPAGTIAASDIDLVHVTDDIDEIVGLIELAAVQHRRPSAPGA